MSITALALAQTQALVHCPEHVQEVPEGCKVECSRNSCGVCGSESCQKCPMPPCRECEGWVTNVSIIMFLKRKVCKDCSLNEECHPEEKYGIKCNAFKILHEQMRKELHG